MKRMIIGVLAMALLANSQADPSAPETAQGSEFVGRYDGNSFETAMGMEVRSDGTFDWGLSVGALDLRAGGTWEQQGNLIILTSDPRPVPPVFRFSGLEPAKGAEFVRVVLASNGEEFEFADIRLTCRNGNEFYGQVRSDGYPSTAALEYEEEMPDEYDPRKSCDAPVTAMLELSMYDVVSEPFDLASLGWTPGQTARFEFERNDLGVADFTGMTGAIQDGTLTLQGGEWQFELRKLAPRVGDAPD